MSDVKTKLKLDDPPIVEAILNIDCDMAPSFSLEAVEESAKQAYASDFPRSEKQMSHRVVVNTLDNLITREITQPSALTFQTLEEKRIVQLRTDGFTFNQLSPYTGFEDFVASFLKSWEAYLRVANPLKVRQVGLRFVNRILLPLNADGGIALVDYLNIGFNVLSAAQKLKLGGFLMQYQAFEPDTGNTANVVLLSQESPYSGTLPIILDIAAIFSGSIPLEETSKLTDRLDSLRNLKNRLFTDNLTPKCLTLFQKSSL